MTDFYGTVTLMRNTSTQVDVEVEFLGGFFIVRAPGNQWLGSWEASKLRKARTGPARYQLKVDRADVFLDIEDHDRFLEILEAAASEAQSKPSGLSKLGFAKNGTDPEQPMEPRPNLQGTVATARRAQSGLGSEDPGVLSAGDQQWAEELRKEMIDYQRDVVAWCESAMTSWFDLHVNGDDDKRPVEQTARGLEEAATELGLLGDKIAGVKSHWDRRGLVDVYALGVESWALALEQIAVGLRIDRESWAKFGIAKIDRGTELVEGMLKEFPQFSPPTFVINALVQLDALVPESESSRPSARPAKEPWKRTLHAAGWSHL